MPVMATPFRIPLSTLKTTQLQDLALRTGIPSSTATKRDLIARLQAQLPQTRLPNVQLVASDADAAPSQKTRNGARSKSAQSEGKHRIASVDFGIRNFACCVLDVPKPLSLKANAAGRPVESTFTGSVRLSRLVSWNRISLAPAQSSTSTSQPVDRALDEHTDFHPAVLSRLALSIVQEHILPHNPTHILLERQRHRSGGSPAILEWTVRVNMLEGMVWAVLRALRGASPPPLAGETSESDREPGAAGSNAAKEGDAPFPHVYSADPKRVGSFWTQTHPCKTPTKEKQSKTKVEKEAKIGMAAEFLRSCSSSTTSISTTTSLHCTTEQAKSMREAFLSSVDGKKRRSGRKLPKGADAQDDEPAGERLTKLDDLADSLLQGLAWVQWEMNRLAILEEYDTFSEQAETMLRGGTASAKGNGSKVAPAAEFRESTERKTRSQARKAVGEVAGTKKSIGRKGNGA